MLRESTHLPQVTQRYKQNRLSAAQDFPSSHPLPWSQSSQEGGARLLGFCFECPLLLPSVCGRPHQEEGATGAECLNNAQAVC